MKLGFYLTPYKKVNSKWTQDLDIRPGTIKLLEENFYDIEFASDFLDITTKAQASKAKHGSTAN